MEFEEVSDLFVSNVVAALTRRLHSTRPKAMLSPGVSIVLELSSQKMNYISILPLGIVGTDVIPAMRVSKPKLALIGIIEAPSPIHHVKSAVAVFMTKLFLSK